MRPLDDLTPHPFCIPLVLIPTGEELHMAKKRKTGQTMLTENDVVQAVAGESRSRTASRAQDVEISG